MGKLNDSYYHQFFDTSIKNLKYSPKIWKSKNKEIKGKMYHKMSIEKCFNRIFSFDSMRKMNLINHVHSCDSKLLMKKKKIKNLRELCMSFLLLIVQFMLPLNRSQTQMNDFNRWMTVVGNYFLYFCKRSFILILANGGTISKHIMW